MWAETKMLNGLTGVLGTTEEESVGAGWRPQSKLVNGESLTTSLLDAGTGSGCEAESGNGELGQF